MSVISYDEDRLDLHVGEIGTDANGVRFLVLNSQAWHNEEDGYRFAILKGTVHDDSGLPYGPGDTAPCLQFTGPITWGKQPLDGYTIQVKMTGQARFERWHLSDPSGHDVRWTALHYVLETWVELGAVLA